MARRYISNSILKGFDSYKYSSLDTSPFANYVMHPFWNAFVKLYPLWVPANTLTFVGFLLLPVNFFALTYYDPDFSKNSNIPQWIWLMCGINNFLSHTLDGTDGKQARRTKTSSVLGELFDHGLDAWSTSFFAIAIYDIFGRGYWGAPPLRFLLVLMAIQCTFIFSHWEKYNTGVLYLPWGYDVALVAMTILYLVTYFFGVELWEFHVEVMEHKLTFANALECFLYSFRSLSLHRSIFALFSVSNYLASVPVCIFNVYLSYRHKTGNMLSIGESLRPLLPVVILFPLIYLWAALSQTDIIDNHPRCYYMLSGTVFANITRLLMPVGTIVVFAVSVHTAHIPYKMQTKMIVNQMSKTRADAFNSLLIPLIVIAPLAATYNLGVYEVYALYTYTIVATLMHINYGIHAVHEIADYLNIYVFSVRRPPPKKKAK